jgi:hypothetical protein
MDKYYYGADATYMIYDGINAAYMTLMSRDLKVAKASGIVEENSYSAGINLDDEKTIKLVANGNDVNYFYLGMDKGDSIEIKQGDVDADAFLGYAVNVYAKKNVNGTYTLLAIAKDSARNSEVSFDVDMFQELKGDKITYEKESGFDATATVAKNFTVLINGVKQNVALAGIFNANGIYRDNELSGKITLIDTDDTTGYEVVNVEVATTAVINNVAANGQISFLNSVFVPEINKANELETGANGKNVSYLKVDPEATDVIINLTKNGEAYDYTELTKYDVLSVKTLAGSGLYNIEVLADGNYIDGYVMATRDSAKEVKLNDGNWYDVDVNGYMVKDLESGDSGRFYIDAFGKLVALDDKVKVEGVEAIAADNYAYILNAISDTDTWGNPSISVQVLDKTGAIYEATLATTTQFVNFDQIDDTFAKDLATIADGLDTGAADYAKKVNAAKVDFSLELADAKAQMNNLAKAIMNNLVSYTSSSNGQIKALTFAQGDEEEDMYLAKSGSGKYDPDDLDLDGVEVDEDTIVFYVSDKLDGGSMTYGQNTSASGVVDFSRVAGIETLAEETYTYVAFDAVDSAAKALVIMNTSGKISPSANVAVIDSIGDTVVGGDKVKIVEYYVGGELKVATTAPDLNLAELKDAAKGDVYQFNVSNGVITNANELMDYSRAIGDVAKNDAAANSAVYFGAINKISAGGSLKLSGGKSISAGDAQTANVYVLDPNLKDELQLYVGSASIAYVNENITEAKSGSKIVVDYEDSTSADDTLVVGTDSLDELLDYAFAFNYDGDTIDIVIYKAYEFDYEIQ